MGCAQSYKHFTGKSRKRILFDGVGEALEPLHQEKEQKDSFNIGEFLKLHDQFMTVKKLEGLSNKTISDHLLFMEYYKRWLIDDVKDYENRSVEKGIFLQYTAYLFQKEYKPCTINIRLRTIKCYLRWLYTEKITTDDISSKIKLVKVPKDTKEPLTISEVKKIFRVLNLNEYSQFRDYVIMLVILDCGVRINELLNVKIEDFNSKDKTIKIGSETAKTRESRVLPLSSKTVRYLKKLMKIAKDNDEDYIFCSSYGDRIMTVNVIKNFEKYGKRAGITNKQTTPHQYRRTFAVEAVKAGIDIFSLQKMLGHSSISTTRIYVNLDNSHIIKAHNKLNIINKFL
ncbi:tyrosine-type recombinase/integrase [Clostridium magnum]|uniref:Tyrosine recombinase XerD n=1 Tax=Clostridium magnum DSM 2767 TaxID=1121326 RepID=A0A162RI96_9CLOT|nr:tyrosine-type recombinase/integrase [Clostridium magnum]KZL89941.1 tyrosine recombinase XerD [Clostridium magnum DSM 2767]SHJ33526.1 integrase/recombinase XerD [Clostridium magnum DSM 2767]